MQVFRVDWHDVPYVDGAFRLLRPGEYFYNSTVAFQYLVTTDTAVRNQYKRIYCAGEGAFFLDGWVEGPLHSAVNCASAVLYQINPASTAARMGPILNEALWTFGKAEANDPAYWNDIIAPLAMIGSPAKLVNETKSAKTQRRP